LYKHISRLIFRVQTKEKTGIHGKLFEGKDGMVFVHLVSSPVENVNFLSTVPISILLSNLISREGKEKMTWYYLKYVLSAALRSPLHLSLRIARWNPTFNLTRSRVPANRRSITHTRLTWWIGPAHFRYRYNKAL